MKNWFVRLFCRHAVAETDHYLIIQLHTGDRSVAASALRIIADNLEANPSISVGGGLYGSGKVYGSYVFTKDEHLVIDQLVQKELNRTMPIEKWIWVDPIGATRCIILEDQGESALVKYKVRQSSVNYNIPKSKLYDSQKDCEKENVREELDLLH